MGLLKRFFASDSAGGICLLVAAIIGVIIANSQWQEMYFQILRMHIGSLETIEWINDALMAVFFLYVGIEIKNEMLNGELKSKSKRFLPCIAALAGVITPGIIFFLIAGGNADHARGWGIPTATDIAFAIGVMAMLGNRVPPAMKAFLVALAIIDDLMAIVVIAVFYGGGISFTYLGIAGVVTAVLVYLNKQGYVRPLPYLMLGSLLWYFVLKSGVHATIAGVVLAMTLPATGVDHFGKTVYPMEDWEKALRNWVTFVIIPIFGLSNAGVSFGDVTFASLFNPVVFGVLLGLFIGKQLGIFMTVYVLVKARVIKMPTATSWLQVYGTAILCGIGFTMSLFVAALAFKPGVTQEQAKLGIFAGSILSGVVGYLVLLVAYRLKRQDKFIKKHHGYSQVDGVQ